MKAIIINPAERSITEATIDYDGNLQPFYDLIGCDLVETIRLGEIGGTMQVAVIDEEGMLKGEQSFTRLGDLPLAGTLVLLGEHIGATGADFTDTTLAIDYVAKLFAVQQWGWMSEAEARGFVAKQQQDQAQAYRDAGYEVELTGDYGFIATAPKDSEG